MVLVICLFFRCLHDSDMLLVENLDNYQTDCQKQLVMILRPADSLGRAQDNSSSTVTLQWLSTALKKKLPA